jgi:WD40 repeat protein
MQSQLPDKEAASATTAIGDAPPPATSTSSEIKELAAYDENDESSFYQIESTEAFKNGEIAGFLYNGYVDDVCVLEVLPNNKLAAGSFDGTIKVWDVHDLSNRLNNVDLLHTLKCKSGVNCLAALEQDLLAAGCSGGAVELWDVQTGSRVRLLAISEAAPELKAKVGGDEVSALAVLSQSRLATAFGSAIVIWNWQTGEKTQVLSNGTAQVRALALLDNGNLASGDEKGTSNTQTPDAPLPSSCVYLSTILRRFVLFSGYIFIWDLSVGKTVNKLFQLSAVDKLVVLADDMLASVCGGCCFLLI